MNPADDPAERLARAARRERLQLSHQFTWTGTEWKCSFCGDVFHLATLRFCPAAPAEAPPRPKE